MFDDPNKALRQLQERLLAMEEEPEEADPVPEAPEDDLEAVKKILDAEPEEARPEEHWAEQRRKRIGALVILLLLEIAVVLAAIGWWLTWK